MILLYFAETVIVVWDHVDTRKATAVKTFIKVDIEEELREAKERQIGIWGLRSHF